jgi:HrpA-like RNA helicase
LTGTKTPAINKNIKGTIASNALFSNISGDITMTILRTIAGSGVDDAYQPFKSAEEAWFWFIQAQTARNEGAKIKSGAGLYARPCEPVDIIKALERIYRARRLTMDHILVLRHYGQRMAAPDQQRPKECRAHKLWNEAMERLEEMLVQKRIVIRPHWIKLVAVNHDAG